MSGLSTDTLKRLPGTVPRDRIGVVEIARHPTDLLDRLLELPDMSSAVADALDQVGRGSATGTTSIAPLTEGMRICGPAITLRYVPIEGDAFVNKERGAGLILGDRDLYGLAKPGDVAVIDASALRDAAVLGGISAAWAQKAEVAGCVVYGTVRDTDSVKATGLPVWSTGRSPRAARYRAEAVVLNSTVTLCGSAVDPGDCIVADSDGLCVIPHALVPTIVRLCEEAQAQEDELLKHLHAAPDVEALVDATRRTAVV